MNEPRDALILSLTTDRWQKLARIVAVASERSADGTRRETIAERIAVLVKAAKLQAKGDLARWTHSEIRRTA